MDDIEAKRLFNNAIRILECEYLDATDEVKDVGMKILKGETNADEEVKKVLKKYE